MTTSHAMRPIVTAALAGLFLVFLVGGIVAKAAEQVPWATGAALQQKLQKERIHIIRWSNVPLRYAVNYLSRNQQVAMLLDRRIDPGQKINVDPQDASLESVLETIGRQCGFEVSRLADVVYLAPPPAARRLRETAATLEKTIRRLPKDLQRTYRRPKRLAWEDFASPRDLLDQIGREGGVKIAGLEKIPHDLWAAADLPALSLANRLLLIAIQFDLVPEITSKGVQLTTVCGHIFWQR